MGISPPLELAPGIRLATGCAETALFPHLGDNTIDAIVTDPPYEIDFTRQVGRQWDREGVAFSVEFWGQALRVAKPGANLVAFGAPRTFHRLVTAVEDAGWEVRDMLLAWVKSYGFPKAVETQQLLRRRGYPELAEKFAGIQNVLKPAHEPILVARKPLQAGATLADNLIQWGCGGLGVDDCRVPTRDDRSRTPGKSKKGDILHMSRGNERSTSHAGGRWPTNLLLVHQPDCEPERHCVNGCPVKDLEAQRNGCARYFPQFRYSGRAPKSERPIVDGIEHHTVKPLSVMEWLVRLAAPLPGMLVMDPFAGSGTTAEACLKLDRQCVMAESEPDYVPLIQQRIQRATA